MSDSWTLNNLDLILRLAVDHIALSIVPILVGFVIAIPLGWVAWRFKLTRGLVLTVTGLLYTIPSIALIVALPALIGTPLLGSGNLTVALTIYAVAIMSRSVADALFSVDDGARQSATALGYSPWRRFWGVEFPLAGPVLLAGLRVVAVSTVALVTVGALVGVQSLGYLFTNGFQRRIVEEIFAGVLATMIVALLFDALLVLLGRLLLPWTRAAKSRTPRRSRSVAFGDGVQRATQGGAL